MKRIILFFAVCLGLSVSQTTFADDADVARAASKRGTATTATAQTSGRTISTNAKRQESNQNTAKNTRTVSKPQQRIVSRTTTNQQNVKPRETTDVKSAATTNKHVSTVSRTSSSRAVSARSTESKIPTFNPAMVRSAVSTQKAKRTSRAAALDSEKISNIKTLNYSNCKTVYYECMDEFCANKDTNLRRCACSSRIHEFDGIKKQLSNAEDKMLNFNQRLLTVSLDKEDAAAINVASEGELAYNKKDTTESEKLLQKITKSLNSSGDSKINNNLSSVSLSLDVDTAWDNIDSMSGIATSSKNGVDLYNAARPVCIEMAREICSDDELDIAQNGYKLTIQQDCDTVAKSYKTQYNNAKEKIYESGALLDMSRLNVYQQRNSDDTLTCKKKITEQLSDASVCGKDLYKCLDTTGKYIDPSTGAAFLSNDLYELTTLLQEPGAGEKWSKIGQNEKFVNFLNSKKKFLEPAMEQCQDIADVVWKEFLDDALAKIKLAQNAKLEEIRRSCTTLIAECKTQALESLSSFDARALSTFSLSADKTVNTMCSDVQDSCANLINADGILTEWESGMTGIFADISYQKVIETCTNIGRDCIIQQCNGTSGNFALCQKATDDNRRAILNRSACWPKVLECVESAYNTESMNVPDRTTYYTSIYDLSAYYNDSDTNTFPPSLCSNTSDKACLIAEQIWGNCEYAPDAYTITTNSNLWNHDNYKEHNKILIPTTGSSLLSWFASNTGTAISMDSCNSLGCNIDYERSNNICQALYARAVTTTDGGNPANPNQVIDVSDSITNYCESGTLDVYGNCCTSNNKDMSTGICTPRNPTEDVKWRAVWLEDLTCTSTDNYFCPIVGNLKLYCVTTSNLTQPIVYYEDYVEYACGATNSGFDQDAFWLLVDSNGNYINPDSTSPNIMKPLMFYRKDRSSCCVYKYGENNQWGFEGECDSSIPVPPTYNELSIEFSVTEQPSTCSLISNGY